MNINKGVPTLSVKDKNEWTPIEEKVALFIRDKYERTASFYKSPAMKKYNLLYVSFDSKFYTYFLPENINIDYLKKKLIYDYNNPSDWKGYGRAKEPKKVY